METDIAMELIDSMIPKFRSEMRGRPFLDRPPLTYSQVGNDTTALNLMIAMVREIHCHTGQIVYIGKIRKGKIAWD